MKNSERRFIHEERGVEPTVLKILVGVVLVTIGLGIGVTLYQRFGEQILDQGFKISFPGHPDGEITLSPNDPEQVEVEITPEFFEGGGGENVDLEATANNGEFVIIPSEQGVQVGHSAMVKIEYTGSESGEYPIEFTATAKEGGASVNEFLTVTIS